MTDPKEPTVSLAENDRACMLVGRYFYYFAIVERTLHRAVSYLFDLKLIQTEMLLANITVRDKTNIVKTAVEYYSRTRADDWAKTAVKTLNQIINETETRNFLAHTSFHAADGGGVDFFKAKAKGKLEVPDIIWREKDFSDKYDHLIYLGTSITSIIEDMKSHKIRTRIAEQLSKPNQGLSSLGLLGGLFPQGLDNLGSSPFETIPQTEPQTQTSEPLKSEE